MDFHFMRCFSFLCACLLLGVEDTQQVTNVGKLHSGQGSILGPRWFNLDYTFSSECGTVTPRGELLIVDGFSSKLGAFPWHVGVYREDGNGTYEQICGGSLISSNLVVSGT